MSQKKEQKDKEIENRKANIWKLENQPKRHNIWVIGVPWREKQTSREEEVIGEIIFKNFSKLSFWLMGPTECTRPPHLEISEPWDKKRLGKASRLKKVTHKGFKIIMTLAIQQQHWKLEDSRTMSLIFWEKKLSAWNYKVGTLSITCEDRVSFNLQ